MNNTVENDFLHFSRQCGHSTQVRWANYNRLMLNFQRISCTKNHKNRMVFDVTQTSQLLL